MAMNISEELDVKFRELDDTSKLMATLSILSNCACAQRRILRIGQLKHAHDYVVTDQAMATAEAVDPAVAASVREIRRGMDVLAQDPPDYIAADLGPRGEALTRDFLWKRDALEDPAWFDIRHAAREGLRIVEGQILQRA